MSNLAEHQNGVSSVGPSPDISAEDQECVKHVMKIFHKHKRHREKYDRNWLHNYKMFRGDQWDGIKMPRFRQKEIFNLIWSSIQSTVPLQTDVRPKIGFVPTEPSDTEFAKVLDDISDSDWERNNWLMPLTEIILDGNLYGLGYGKPGYDALSDFGMGSATFESEDPFYCYPDPECRQVNDRYSRAFILAVPTDTDRLKAEYPDHANLIKSDIQDAIASSKTSLNDFKYKAANTDRDMPDITGFDGKETGSSKSLVITLYEHPDDTEEFQEQDGDPDPQTGEVQYKKITKKKYPNGRMVKIVSGIKLEEGPLPFEHGEFPVCKYINYMLPREFFGVSEVEQLESPQRVFNKILNAQLEIMSLMGNPVWIIDHASGVDPDGLVNRTGLVVQKEPGTEVSRVDGIQLSPAAMSLIDRSVEWFNKISGDTDVSHGEAPGSVTASSAIEQLMHAARTRIRGKQRNLDIFIRDFGRQYVSIVLEKYSQARVFRVTNNEGQAKYFKMSVDKVDTPEGKKTRASVREYGLSPEGQPVEGNVKEYLISGRFDVKVNTESSLPFAKAENETRSIKLFELGVIDEEELLKNIDYPNREAVLARLQERKAQEAAMQQQQGA